MTRIGLTINDLPIIGDIYSAKYVGQQMKELHKIQTRFEEPYALVLRKEK